MSLFAAAKASISAFPDTYAFCFCAGGSKAVVDLVSPIVAAKAIKNGAELEGMRQAHLRDAVAICDFLQWLEAKVCMVVCI